MINSLIIREEHTLIEKNLSGSVDYETLYLNEDFEISDTFLNGVVKDLMNSRDYSSIFIPLCFGPITSDFNGLRLATHIRCSPGINQNKNIYIFSFVEIDQLINQECFDILKTKGVQLVKYNFYTIQEIIDKSVIELVLDNLPSEIKKLNLQIPNNYEDNHSIANEWAIYRWSQIIGASDINIEKINEIQNSNLYFKYLKTIYPISKSDTIENNKLKINFEGNSKILYIDDEADKGWREIFETIFYDKNENIDFSYLDNEFNEKTKEEIINISLKTIKDEDIDLVILDFRLHKDDFDNNEIETITGYQILKKIKEYNKGIQVIIFSATNKIWNLQALQEAGADGFIVKESPENSNNPNFTKQSILRLVKTIENRLNMIFLKNVFPIIEKINLHLNKVPNNNGEPGLDGLMKIKFKNEIFIQLDIIYDCLEKSSLKISTTIEDEHSYFNLSFISIFKIIELINDFYTDEKGIVLKSNKTKIQSYNQNENSFNEIPTQHPTTRDKIYTIIKFELNDEPKKYVTKLNPFIKFRNNITHPKTLKEYKKTTKEENLAFLELMGDLIEKIN